MEAGPDAEIRVGNALPLSNIPTGTQVHNIEMQPGRGGQICRGAGTSTQVLAREEQDHTGAAPQFVRDGGVDVIARGHLLGVAIETRVDL